MSAVNDDIVLATCQAPRENPKTPVLAPLNSHSLAPWGANDLGTCSKANTHQTLDAGFLNFSKTAPRGAFDLDPFLSVRIFQTDVESFEKKTPGA